VVLSNGLLLDPARLVIPGLSDSGTPGTFRGHRRFWTGLFMETWYDRPVPMGTLCPSSSRPWT